MKPLKPIVSTKIYFPGLISIILLPIISIVLYFYQARYAMPVNWLDKKGLERWNKSSRKEIDFDNFRNFSSLYLTGDEKHDKAALNRFTSWADSFVVKDDFKNGMRIVLTNRTKFQDLVTALDIGMNHKRLGVIQYYDQIYLFKYPLDPSKTVNGNIFNDIVLYSDVIPDFPPQRSFLENAWIKSKIGFHALSSFWPCLFPLMGMIYFWKKSNVGPNSQRQKRDIIR